MARTYRDKILSGAAYAARYAFWDTLPIGAYPDQFAEGDAERPRNFQRLKGGNMVMGHRASGEWNDCRFKRSKDRKGQRRMHKRRERQMVQRQINKEME